MKLRTKILLIVAVMGLVIVGIGGMAVTITNVYSRQVSELEAASARAFNGEHLNRLVTAVVMDARGIYASDTVEQAKPFGDGILASLDKIDAHLAAWRPLVKAEDMAAFEKVVARTDEFRAFRSETARLGTIDPALGQRAGQQRSQPCQPQGLPGRDRRGREEGPGRLRRAQRRPARASSRSCCRASSA